MHHCMSTQDGFDYLGKAFLAFLAFIKLFAAFVSVSKDWGANADVSHANAFAYSHILWKIFY